MTQPNNQIDPLSWISAERKVVNSFVAINAQAVSDLGDSIATFQIAIDAEAQSEAQFTNDLASLTGAVNPATLLQTIQDLTTADTSIDAKFTQLQTTILQNNQSATNLASHVSAQAPSIQQISDTRNAMQSKIANYQSILNTFRTFGGNITAADSIGINNNTSS